MSGLAASAWSGNGSASSEDIRPFGLQVNTASESEWTLLPGVGPRTAHSLDLARREGCFADCSNDGELMAALLEVPGVGPLTLQRIMPFLAADAEPGMKP
jgi:DNA uptake protein ComE-like DNA-binding protein